MPAPSTDEAALEAGLVRDRLRRQRSVAIIILLVCAAGLAMFWFLVWPGASEGMLSPWGWVRIGWWAMIAAAYFVRELYVVISVTIALQKT